MAMTKSSEQAMTIELTGEVVRDGCVALDWRNGSEVQSVHLLIIRTGAVPSYTALQLDGGTRRYRIDHLSRHQRYLVCVLVHLTTGSAGSRRLSCSRWLSVTPRAGLAPITDETSGVESHLASPSKLSVMPQDRRITVYWSASAGFVDRFLLEVLKGERCIRRLELEPEVSSISLDAGRGVQLQNGQTYSVRLRTCFASRVMGEAPAVRCVPAPQGQERHANQDLPQDHLIYPSLSLSPEIQIFEEEEQDSAQAAGEALVCRHCGQPVQWRDYQLRCDGCGARYISNGKGAHLELSRLRFGTCRCCMPEKILIQRSGSQALTCAHSGKEHIRMPGATAGFHLIEDLPHGLCQCCRPRRPLINKRGEIRCSKSDEKHRNQEGRYVLVPSDPVFDATAIDDLLDAGLAEICASGVSKGRRSGARR